MPTTIKKKTKKIAEDPLSSSGVSSLSGISSYNIRKISIYKNGDRFHRGVKFVINPRVIKDMEPLLNQINDRIELSHGAKKLYSADGKMVASIKELEDGKIYVAASGHFIPMRYGEFTERVWKPPSRKHSPIMSADRIKTARTRSQEPGKRRQQQQQLTAEGSQIGSGVQRSRSVRTLAEDRKSRRDVSRGNSSVKTNGVAPPIPKRPEMVRPKVGAKVERKPIPTNKKPPTPKRGINKKVLGAAMGAGVAVVGAAAIGATMTKKPKTPAKPIATAVSDISTASSVIPAPNIESNAAEILEFPEEEKKVDMATIHRTPTPPRAPTAPMSRSNSAKSAKSLARKPSTPGEKAAMVMEAKSISQQPTPESSEEEEEEEEEEDDEEESVEDDEEEEGSEQEEEDAEDEEEEDEEEEEEEEGSGVETPASRRSSSAVSSARSAPKSAKSTRSEKSSAK